VEIVRTNGSTTNMDARRRDSVEKAALLLARTSLRNFFDLDLDPITNVVPT